MKATHPFIAVSPHILDGLLIKRMGKAWGLYCCLARWRTELDGTVNYGKLVTYADIEKRMKNAPPRRTLQSWMATLRTEGFAVVELVRRHGFVRGMRVKIWAPEAQEQLKLFPVKNILEFASPEKPNANSGAAASRAASTAPPKKTAERHLWNLEQKAARLESEIQMAIGAYPGSLELPAAVNEKVKEFALELDLTRSAIREYEIAVGRKAG